MALVSVGFYAGSSPGGWATLPDLLQPPQVSQKNSPTPVSETQPPQPSEAGLGGALGGVETRTSNVSPSGGPASSTPAFTAPGFSRTTGVILYLSVGFVLIVLLGWTVQNAARRIHSWAAASTSNRSSGTRRRTGTTPAAKLSKQAEVETLLERLAAGDSAALDRVLGESDGWLGRAQRTPRTNQYIMATLNQHDLKMRGAALQATLALDGVSRDHAGLNRLELAVTNPNQRAWALWMLGALGNRGVEQERAAQILKGYLDDADERTRSEAVDGLGIVASDETVQILLERFRRDSSPLVQESAARNLAEAGMYTREQRMAAAASFVEWIDDVFLTPQQKSWAGHALRDISGQNFGMDAAAWQRWYNSSR